MERDVRGREREEQPLGYSPTEGLTLEEDQKLAVLLSKWTGGRISTPVFTELARMIPQPIVEVVILRMNEGRLETLLIPRPEDDIVWPGMFHTPGTAIRRTDFLREDRNPLNGVFERIQRGELNNEFVQMPTYAGRMYRMSERGPDVSEIYIASINENLSDSRQIWYPVDGLENNPSFIQSQLGHVKLAADYYLKQIE